MNLSADYLSSTDLENRLSELESDRDYYQNEVDSCREIVSDITERMGACQEGSDLEGELEEAKRDMAKAESDLSGWFEDNEDELNTLKEICEDGRREISGWHSGVTLTHEGELENYVQDVASDLSGIDISQWPCTCIDWAVAAKWYALDLDCIEIEGATYYAV